MEKLIEHINLFTCYSCGHNQQMNRKSWNIKQLESYFLVLPQIEQMKEANTLINHKVIVKKNENG